MENQCKYQIQAAHVCKLGWNPLDTGPIQNDDKDYHVPDGQLQDYRIIDLILIYSEYLFSTIDIKPGLVVDDLFGSRILFAFA